MSDTATAMSDVAQVKAEDTSVQVNVSSSPLASSSASSAPVAPALSQQARKFPAEYYLVPSTTTNSNMPSYTQEELDSFALLPPDSIGYVQVKRRFLVNPRSGAAASVAPAPQSADANSSKAEQPNANKAAKVSSQSSAPEAVTRDESNGAEASKCEESGECRSAEAAVATEEGDKEGNDKDSRKRKRGQNKNSEREMYKSSEVGEVRLCKATAAGLECKWKDSCRYSHDVAAFNASRAAPIPEVCPVWKKYGTCAAGLMCRFAGHAESDKPADPPAAPFNTPMGNELNIPSQQLLQSMRSCGLKGKLYEATFPKSIALMKLHDAWKIKYDKLREKRQADKERLQREQNKAQALAEKKAALDKKVAAALAAAKAVTENQAADSSMTDVASTPSATSAASEAAAPVAANAALAAATPSSAEVGAAAAPTPASSSSSTPAAVSATPAATGAAAITSTILPPTFPVHTQEEEIEIAAMKAQYTPPFPKKLDPFQIVPAATEKYCDWSSGMILIDIERKPFTFKDKLVLAPLTTVGNLPFRLVAREFGADVTIGEMALVSSINRGMVGEWALLRRHRLEKYFGVQIAGAFPDQIARACEHINTQCQVDFVDYNIGCPIDPVTSKGMGSSLMQRKRIKNVEPICRTLTSMLDCPATIKMRMGWSATEITAMELLPVVKRAGMAAVTIHGRTRQQRYTKAANWEFIHEAANFCHDKLDNLPVIANGDVYTFEDYEGLINPNSNITTTMIARGALIKPWIFTEIRERRHWDISATERLEMLKTFVSYAFEHFGTDTKGLENTRRYLLEWLSFLCRYVPIGLLEIPRVQMQLKSPYYYARSDLEQLLCSTDCKDWIRISEILIGPTPDNFRFIPKHKSSATDESGSQNVEG